MPFAASTTSELSSFVPNQVITVDIEPGVILGVCGRLSPFFLAFKWIIIISVSLRTPHVGEGLMHGVRMYVRCLGVMMQLMRDPAVRGSVHAKTTLLLGRGLSAHPRVHRHETLSSLRRKGACDADIGLRK